MLDIQKVHQLCATVLQCDSNGPDWRVSDSQTLAREVLDSLPDDPVIIPTGSHTPGPWRVYQYSDSLNAPQYTVGTMGGDRIADNLERGRPTAEAHANARLIAETPRLLEAGVNLLYYYNAFRDSSPKGPTEIEDIASATALLKSLTGR
jgi:hypothetical protein